MVITGGEGNITRSNYATGETVILRGPTVQVRVTDGDMLLLADEVRYNNKTEIAVARGNVSLNRDAQRLLADEITYTASTHTYVVNNPRLTLKSFFILGSTLTGNPDSITIQDARVSLSEPGPWVPTLTAGTLHYNHNDQSIRPEHAHLGLGDLRFFPLPAFTQPLQEPFTGDLSVKTGYRSRFGAYLDLGVLTPVATGLQLGGDVGVYSSRGALVGPSASYLIDRPGLSLTDSLRTDYIHDYGNRHTDILGRNVPADRGFVTWSHHEQIGDDLTLIGKLNYWSDSEVVRDFRPKEFAAVQVPDSFFEADHADTNSILSAFVRAQPNSYFDMQQRLPEVDFDQFATPLALGVYESFHASAAVLRDDPPTPAPPAPPPATPVPSSRRVDAYYELTRPFTPAEWFSVKPVVGARMTYYADATGGRSTFTRNLGEIGADAELHASATYDYQNAFWGIDGLRHLVTPVLSYRYIPDATKGTPFIPAVDRDAFSTYLQPLGFAGTRNIDQLAATNTLRLGLNNTLQTRDPHYGSRDLATLDFAADWSFDPQSGQRAFSAIYTELAVMPISWLRFDSFSRVDPNTGGVRELNTGVTLHDGTVWTARIATHYLKHQIEQYVVDASYRIDEVDRLLARAQYDARLNRLTEQDYGLEQTLGNLWLVRYFLSLREGPAREGPIGLNFELEMKRF